MLRLCTGFGTPVAWDAPTSAPSVKLRIKLLNLKAKPTSILYTVTGLFLTELLFSFRTSGTFSVWEICWDRHWEHSVGTSLVKGRFVCVPYV